MDILLKSAKIIDEESAYHGAVKDILISDGVIKQISNHIAAEGVDKVLENFSTKLVYHKVGRIAVFALANQALKSGRP